MIQDFMFGDLNLPENRLNAHRSILKGVHHRMAVVPARPQSKDSIRFQATTSGSIPFSSVRVFYTLDGSMPEAETSSILELDETGVSWDEVDWNYVRHWEGSLPSQPEGTYLRYHLGAQVTGSDTWIYADNQASDAGLATDFAVWISDVPVPEWTRNALIYHVFVDRFFPGRGKSWQTPEALDGFFGGTIRGVEEKLDYIQELGYNTIWLSPFFVSPTHHGYDAIDMYQVEPRLGTNEDLFSLIEAAHKRGMRLILDFVANHWSNLHASMQEARKDRNSPYYDWYLWKKWPDEYEGFFGLKIMPKINLAAGSQARRHLLDCARFWLEKGFDGFRLDYAYGPPIDFWVEFRKVCKETRPDCWLFGEVIHSATTQAGFAPAFDGLIDFLLTEAVRQTFGYGRWKIDEFDAYLGAHEGYFRGMVDRLTILDNHDMNRFLFLSGDDTRRLKLAAQLIYTIDGSPINYYGTEAGVSQKLPTHHDDRGYFEEARLPMLWDGDADKEVLEYFRALLAVIQQHPELRSGTRRTVHLDGQTGTYVYLREDGDNGCLSAYNLSDEARVVRIGIRGFGGAVDLLNQQMVETDADGVSIHLKPLSGAIVGKA